MPRRTLFPPVDLDVDTADKNRALNANQALRPGCILEGRVTYADTGKPAPHAHVIAFRAEGSTDEKGEFRLNTYVQDSWMPEITAYAPEGEPYQVVKKYFERPKGATRLKTNLALPRGICVRGKVVEEGSGKPVMGAEVRYGPHRFDEAIDPNKAVSAVVTGPDGVFQVVCLPGPGHLLVKGPDPDYIVREFDCHGLAMFDLKPDEKPSEVTIPLRRGVTLRGRLVDGAGNPVAEAEMFSRVIARQGKKSQARVSNGHFALHGCDPKEAMPWSSSMRRTGWRPP
jgi:hypothetical protein